MFQQARFLENISKTFKFTKFKHDFLRAIVSDVNRKTVSQNKGASFTDLFNFA